MGCSDAAYIIMLNIGFLICGCPQSTEPYIHPMMLFEYSPEIQQVKKTKQLAMIGHLREKGGIWGLSEEIAGRGRERRKKTEVEEVAMGRDEI